MSNEDIHIDKSDIADAIPKVSYPQKSGETISDDDDKKIERKLSSFEFKSGIRVTYKNKVFSFFAPHTGEMVISGQKAIELQNDNEEILRNLDQDRKNKMLKYLFINEKIGGIGITDRNLEKILSIFPGINEKIKSSRSISFIGSGFSSAPLELSKIYPDIQIRVSDMFDYLEVKNDLERLLVELSKDGVLELPQIKQILLTITDTLSQSNIKITSKYKFGGSDKAPQELHGSDLVINVQGPPSSTLVDQLALLSEGGELWTTNTATTIPDGFQMAVSDPKTMVIRRN